MEPTISSLSSQCRNIEQRIENEKTKLRSMKETIQKYKTNQAVAVEMERNEERKEVIQQCREKVQLLKHEFGNLRNAIAEIESERTDVVVPTLEKKKRSLNVMSAEVDMWNCEIRKVEKQIQKVKDVNTWMEDDNKRKIQECQENHESKSSGSVRVGRLRMEEEIAKNTLNSLKENLKKVLKGMRTLENNLKEVASKCMMEEKNIDMKEYYYLTLLENNVLKRKRDCGLLELQIEKEKFKLNELKRVLENQKTNLAISNLTEACKLGEEQIKQYKLEIEELRLEYGILSGAIVKIKREKSDFHDTFTKKIEMSKRKVNSEIARMKDEVVSIDDKMKNIKKVMDWSVHNYQKKFRELLEVPLLDQYKFFRIRVEEDEARKSVDILRENFRKLKEQVDFLRGTLFNIQAQCEAEERKSEDILNALQELKRVEQMALNEEIRVRTCMMASNEKLY